jgi:hypothetical protein
MFYFLLDFFFIIHVLITVHADYKWRRIVNAPEKDTLNKVLLRRSDKNVIQIGSLINELFDV